ncbi:MAG TPA: hypothetical protein VMF69_11955 [Gemmataceae bacterium]|nr:hypothetical protein [Gemmataceae bacterium]
MNVSEAAKKVIDLSGKIRDYYEAELPKRYPNYPLVELEDLETEDDFPPPEEKELNDFLATLPAETIYQLYLLRHLGRWEFGANDLAVNYERLKKMIGTAEQAVFEMMTFKATLADNLLEGLEELRKHNINTDKMPLKKAKARKR